MGRLPVCVHTSGLTRSWSSSAVQVSIPPRQSLSGQQVPNRGETGRILKTNRFWRLLGMPPRRRQWHPTPVLLPGKSHGRQSLVGCSPPTLSGAWLSHKHLLTEAQNLLKALVPIPQPPGQQVPNDHLDLVVQLHLTGMPFSTHSKVSILICAPAEDKIPSLKYIKWKWKWSCSVVSNSLQPGGPTRLLRPWDSPGNNTGVGRHFLLQGIFPTQGLKPGLSHCRQPLNHQGSVKKAKM